LRDKHIINSSWITLRPLFYKDPNECIIETKWFKGVGSNDRFFQCLKNMLEVSIEEKNQCFFIGIIWELVDGQHVEHACNILAKNDQSM
jgi:hypothetical protein